jgi:tetratricopeptide (TPR) repeat protein
MALTKLGRNEEAGAALGQSLSRDPHNAVTHANQGWTYLHQGDHKKALEHFREALRIDPELDFARAGMVEALKSRHLIYRIMLRYFLWMGRLGRQAQWGIIIGLYVGYEVVLRTARADPKLAPYLYPLVVLYIVFVYLTWTASPLFNLLLRLNRFGRYALSRSQTITSNWIGASLLLAILSGVIWLITRNFTAVLAAVYFLVMVIGLAGAFRVQEGWPKWAMFAYTALLAVVGAGAVLCFHFGQSLQSETIFDNGQSLATAFFLGIFFQSIVSNVLAGITIKK